MSHENIQTHTLIGSDQVEGTAVYGADKEKIGSVDSLLIEKQTGRVTDAILSVGGFLRIGDEKHSLPWEKLNYDTDLGGYCLDVTEDQLRNAPSFNNADQAKVYDRSYQNGVYNYWAVQPTW